MPENKNYLTSGEFAKLCNTTKVTLRHYKDIGILMPKYEGENGYLYYEAEQFYDYYSIAIFKQTGTPLAQIKACMNHQNVPAILETLKRQQIQLEEEKKKIEQMTFIVKNSILNMDIGNSDQFKNLIPQIAYFEKEHLLAIPTSEFEIKERDKYNEDAMLIAVLRKCKEICEKYSVQADYQLGAIRSCDKIFSENIPISHIYTKINRAYKNPYYVEKPSGNYLCILNKGKWDSSIAYQKLLSYIEENNIKVVGSIYAYDLAGFMINGVEENAMTLLSMQVVD